MVSVNNIWLAYTRLPYTTAVYYEKALKKNYQVLTMGPTPGEEIIQKWQLESIRHLIRNNDLILGLKPDMREIYKIYRSVFPPSLYLWIESGLGFLPQNLEALPCIKAAIFIDSHINLEYQLNYAKYFDFVFVAQLQYVNNFQRNGINAHWLPLAADVDIHKSTNQEKMHEISMVGSIFKNSRRENLINKIKEHYQFYSERCFLEDMAKVYDRSKIVFNNAVNNDLNMRIFEALSVGSFLLTDIAKNSGQEILFEDQNEYGLYDDSNLISKLNYFLHNSEQRERIAKKGQKTVHAAHQYIHRTTDMINVIKQNKKNTFNPYELRELSQNENKKLNINAELVKLKRPMINEKISFVIPVLDFSPASEYNINTLLKDLEDIDGEVIVVFNNEDVANQIKNNPRINHYAILKKNIGVSRAWNIGLNISRADYTFILNADLKISSKAVEELLKYAKNLDKAALIGPQGAFFDFKSMNDFYYFDKGSFNRPIHVDAVSGFFFLINNKLFNENKLSFDNRYTPCYREEWDIGLQIKLVGLRCYIVPVKDYEHHWSGSIRSYKKINYYDNFESPQEILERTGQDFQKKWKNISEKCDKSLLESGWKKFALAAIEELIMTKHLDQASKISNLLIQQFPNDFEVLSQHGYALYHIGRIEESYISFQKSISIKNDYQIALKNIEIIKKNLFIKISSHIEKLVESIDKKNVSNYFLKQESEILSNVFVELIGKISITDLINWVNKYIIFIANERYSMNGYQNLRVISIQSNFRYNLYSKRNYRKFFKSKLELTQKSTKIFRDLEIEGYSIIAPTIESIKFVNETNQYLSNLNVRREKDGVIGNLKSFLKNPIPGAFRYFYLEEDLPVNPVINLLKNSGVIRGISDYIGHPILRCINAWVSTAPSSYDAQDMLTAAQAYHFDNDNPSGWTKVFIYLSDVDLDSGPHVYVPRSHLGLPDKLKRDGRFTDKEIKENIGEGSNLTGKAGTIIIADTLGMHKALPVKSGVRIIFQVEFVTSLFGEITPIHSDAEKILSQLPEFMDQRLSYRYIRDTKLNINQNKKE